MGKMTGHRCCVCGNTKAHDPSVTFHRIPFDKKRRTLWIEIFNLKEEDFKESTRVCCRHFPDGDPNMSPSVQLGKRFAFPMKKDNRSKRAKTRHDASVERELRSRSVTPLVESSSRSVTPVDLHSDLNPCFSQGLTVTAGEQLRSDYTVHELPAVDEPVSKLTSSDTQIINRALIARIEFLEAENKRLKEQQVVKKYFRLEDIQDDDKLVRFYTGFVSFSVLLAFFNFLGQVVNHLNYWGSKEGNRVRYRKRKLDPLNQLFLMLVKLRLNSKVLDLALRFGLSGSQTSCYITTWVCFLYRHLSEINWMPAVDKVMATQPSSFKEKFPSTYAIIDGSEVFIETPSDLQMQSSTWSQYKHHNTVKFLVACTPNGAISFISPVYVGSISDVELTRVSGLLTVLEDKLAYLSWQIEVSQLRTC